MTLRDLVRVDTLGMGGFGRVELVRMGFVVQSNHEQSLPCESGVFLNGSYCNLMQRERERGVHDLKVLCSVQSDVLSSPLGATKV